MARIAIPVTKITTDGVTPPAATVGDGANDHEILDNDGQVFLEVENTDVGGAHLVTVVTPKQVEGLDVADVAVMVPASETRLIGPFPPRLFNQADGTLHVDVADDQLSMRAYRL